MYDINDEETEKFHLLQKEMYREKDFLKKLNEIFEIINSEKFKDILVLHKNKYIDQVVKEVLLILKNIYSDKIMTNKKFNTLFQLSKEDFEKKYNTCYNEIAEEWENFYNMKKNDEEDIKSFYLTDFRKHCHNHEGFAMHKCGRGENGKFIKILISSGSRFRSIKELKYVICEECKKVYHKDLFNNYCPHCKENYLCSTSVPNGNKECYIATYSNPHCDALVNKTILCDICKEKLYLFVKEKKIKCLNPKCEYVIDLKNKNELQWKCNKCNGLFRSNVKIYNPSENYILTKILKKALLLKTKAIPPFTMNCCNFDANNATFYHKKDCKGILYICNIENYFLKNKKWVIVCEKCHAINNFKNFIWTCPNCGKRVKEGVNEAEENTKNSPIQKKESYIRKGLKYYNITQVNEESNYLSNYKTKNIAITCNQNDEVKNNNRGKRNDFHNSYGKIKNVDNKKNRLFQVIYNLDIPKKENDYLNNNNNSKNYGRKDNINKSNFNKRENKAGSNLAIENENYETKNIENPRSYARKKNSSLYINQTKKEEEKNNDKKFFGRNIDNSYKVPLNNDRKKISNTNLNNEYYTKDNYEKNKVNINEKINNSAFNNDNARNIPVRLRYKNDKNSKDRHRKKLEHEESDFNNKKKEYYYKKNNNSNNEEINLGNKKLNFLLNSVDGLYAMKNNKKNSKNSTEGRISKETTTHGSKGSITSSNKDIYIVSNLNSRKFENKSNNTSKDKDCNFSSTSNNFKNRRKFYLQEKEKLKNYENNTNIINIKKNVINSVLHYKYNKNNQPIIEQNDNDIMDNIIDIVKENDKPDDVIDPCDINYNEEIPISNKKIIENKDLYEKIQTGIKNILEKGKLPQFNIDNYTIGKKIGDGAFGVLFSVTNNKTNKKYALKKLTACDLNSLEEFQKEFIIAYQSNHKNILNLYGICIRVYDSTTFALFVLMDLAECDWEIEINKRFKEKNFYTEEELIDILKQLSSACLYLQNKKVAHRDIKPENILLFHENNKAIYKICDFGEAKEKIKENQRHKSIRGTDFYMSPILFKGLTSEEKFVRDNAFKSDVFSLGYCMIIACVLDFNFINKIRNVEEQSKLEEIIRSNLEDKYSDKFINLLLKMTIFYEKERVDFIGLQKLLKEEL